MGLEIILSYWDIPSLKNLGAKTLIRGRMLVPHPNQAHWRYLNDGLIAIGENGIILGVKQNITADISEIPETRPGCIWMPGFVDTHLHFPQTNIIGSASGALLPWLEKSVFPEESKFSDMEYSAVVAQKFCDSLLKNGTTCAAIYSSSHLDSTHMLFHTLAQRGLRAEVGMTLMNRNAKDSLLVPTSLAMENAERLIKKWHGHDQNRLRFCVTPRFAISCTSDLLKAAGDLAEKYDLMIQTHISENTDELVATAQLFPTSKDYLAVYEEYGLLTSKSLFAHCIYLNHREMHKIAEVGASISHCPDSNFFLGSGQMPLQQLKSLGMKIALGTDVGAGRTFSMSKACARAYDASRITKSQTSASELLWMATRGGAIAMGKGNQIGSFANGYEADLIAVRPANETWEDIYQLCDQLVFQEDHQGVQEVWIKGRKVWG
jgi:guanine deaminase